MFETNPVNLTDLLTNVSSGKIQLPDFQRGWVWDDDRIKGLLSSISRGFPIGAFLTIEAGGDLRFRARPIEGADGVLPNDAEALLLDGQQRLTSLYQALRYEGPVKTIDSRKKQVQHWYYVDMLAAMNPEVDRDDAIISIPADKKETPNIGREPARDLSTQELEYQHHMMPTEQLLDTRTDWTQFYIDYWNKNGSHPEGAPREFVNRFIALFKEAFTRYRVPVIRLDKDNTREAVCTVFQKVNQGGVLLGTFELITASFAGSDDFSLRDDWDTRQKRLRAHYSVLQNIEGDHFLQAIALLASQDNHRQARKKGSPIKPISCKKEAILALEVADYQRWADEAEAGFEEAARFLSEQFVFTKENVPYNAQLVPLAALCVELKGELEADNTRTKLERWFWSGIFGERYNSGTETQSANDLVSVADWIRGGPLPSMINEASFVPERLLSLKTRASAAYKGLYALQMKGGATDWRKGEQLSLSILKEDGIDIHHIFPTRWCQQATPPILSELSNLVINKTPIDAKTNRTIGGKAPSGYLRILRQDISEDDLNDVLRSHSINPVALANNDFAEFFVERGEALLQLIGNAMGKQLPSGKEVFAEALSNSGFNVEFVDDEVEYDPTGGEAFDDDFIAVAD